jgi:hypothetical protein
MSADPRRSWTLRTTNTPSEYATVQPWAAAGPGWANCGVYIREPLESKLGTCVHTSQLGPRANALLPVALAAVSALLAAIRAEGYTDANG